MDVRENPPAHMRSLIVRFWFGAEAGEWRVLVKPVGSEEVRHFASVAVFIAWVDENFGRNAGTEVSSGEE